MRQPKIESFEAGDEDAVVYEVASRGLKKTASIRVCGYVIVNGERYEFDRHIKIQLKKMEGN